MFLRLSGSDITTQRLQTGGNDSSYCNAVHSLCDEQDLPETMMICVHFFTAVRLVQFLKEVKMKARVC